MKIFDKSSINGKIIRSLGMGVGITVALSNKRTSYKMTKTLIKEIFNQEERPKNFSQYFFKLRKQKLIAIKKIYQEHKIILTENGQKIFLRFNYDKLNVKTPKIWDRNFRMVIFDIPEKKRSARDSLRNKLKELGFVKFNDSVWVFPYPCQKEIDFIANYWGIGRYVQFALVKDLTNKEKLEKHFNL